MEALPRARSGCIFHEVFAMKRTAFLLAAALAVCSAQRLSADHFHVGGHHHHHAGEVRFKLNGGAGPNPRFHIGGLDHHHHHHHHANLIDPVDGDDHLRHAHWDHDHHDADIAGGNIVAVGYGGWGGGWGHAFGDGGFSNLYNQGFIPVPPYFSLHPPVYYSVPVPRTYGYGPFAYPGSVPTPDVQLGPEEIVNPHVEPEDEDGAPEAEEAAAKTAAASRPAPLVVRNPFVEQHDVKLTASEVE
jgi:hypothetical protein